MTEAEAISQMHSAMKGIGPKSVETPNMKVTAHDPKDVQAVLERRLLPQQMGICCLGGCVGVPNRRAFDNPNLHRDCE